MWKRFAISLISNQRKYLLGLLVLILLLIFGIYKNGLRYSTSTAQLLPKTDSAYINFEKFKGKFGKDDSSIFLGFYVKDFKTEKQYNDFNNLLNYIKNQNGIKNIISVNNAIYLNKDTVNQKFIISQISKKIENLKSWKESNENIKKFPFYEKRLFNSQTDAQQIIITLKPEFLDTKNRETLVLDINNKIESFEKQNSIELYASGMPLIRTMNKQIVVQESALYIIAALFVTLFMFFLLFRSFKATLIVLCVVLISILACFGTIAMLRYEISILTGLVPPIMIVICVPNCVFIINKYFQEVRRHKNKVNGIITSITKIGKATMLTNLTTAFGFFTFIFTDSHTLQEFGLVASINIAIIFITCLVLIPICLMNIKVEIKKENQSKIKISERLNIFLFSIIKKRKIYIYSIFIISIFISIYGISLLKNSSNILDDMSKHAKYYKEISFFDSNFDGILPLEIIISGEPKSATNYNKIKKIEELSFFIDSLGKSSKLLSINDLIKFSNQAFYLNDPNYFQLPSKSERTFLMRYIKNSKGNSNQLNSYLDKNQSTLRLTTLLKNMNSDELEKTVHKIEQKSNDLFQKQNIYITGGAYLFMKGTEYLTTNLISSIFLAFFLISLIMALMFRSVYMVIFSLIPNILPLLLVGGIMGFLGVPIKPSTILVFSISFGIAVDDTIHFLAKYKQELKKYDNNIKLAVTFAFKDTAQSMYFSSIILFSGFFTFFFSGFDGIKALGGLVGLTLFFAMITNLIVLPSLLLSFHKLRILNNKKKRDLLK